MLALLLTLALLLRLLAVLALPPEDDYPDSIDYLGFARVLADGTGWLHESLRPPLYPLVLAVLVRPGGGLLAVKLLQVLLDLLLLALLVAMARRLGIDRRLALLAGALWAVNPFAIQFARLILSEPLGDVLLVAALGVWVQLFREPHARGGAVAGVLLSASALTRASALPVIPVAIALLAACGPAPAPERRRAALALAASAALLIAPWTARNYAVYGEVVLVAPTGGRSLWDGLSDYADGGPRYRGPSVWPHVGNAARDDRLYRELAVQWAREHPGRVLSLALEKQKRFWSPIPNIEKYRRMPYLLVAFYEAPLIAAGLAGCALALMRRRRAAVLVPVVACFAALHTVYLGSVRYRMPIEPLQCLIAALLVQEAFLGGSAPEADAAV